MNLDELLPTIPDDAEFDLGDKGKIKGADLKTYFNTQRGTLTAREQLQQQQTELTRLKKYEEDSSALFAAAARMPIEDRTAALVVNPNEYDPMKDPLLGEPFSKFRDRFGKEIREEITAQYKPIIDQLATRNDALTRALFDDRQKQDFREAGEWPEGWNLQKAREYAKEKGYWQPNGDKWGLADIGRIHNEVTEPLRRSKFEEDTKKNARDEAIRALRAEGATINIPNRSMGGGAKPVQVKGKNGEEILSNALAQAGQDMETMRMLEGLRG